MTRNRAMDKCEPLQLLRIRKFRHAQGFRQRLKRTQNIERKRWQRLEHRIAGREMPSFSPKCEIDNWSANLGMTSNEVSPRKDWA